MCMGINEKKVGGSKNIPGRSKIWKDPTAGKSIAGLRNESLLDYKKILSYIVLNLLPKGKNEPLSAIHTAET